MNSRTTLNILMALYYPFLAGICLLAGVMAGLLFLAATGLPLLLAAFLVVVGLYLVFTMFHILYSCRGLVLRQKREDDPDEIKLSKAWMKPIKDFVAEVARRRKLPEPNDIRLHVQSVAHVYEDDDGDRILVIGGIALGCFSKEALAGVIAHELGHFEGGDTDLTRTAGFWGDTINHLESGFATQRLAWFNPLVWMMRGYHLLFMLAWAANSREQEYAADRFEVEHVGKEQAAATLVFMDVVNHLPWSRLTSIAESCVAVNEPLDGIFSEQLRRARVTSAIEWNDGLSKALKEQTGAFDSHPCLKERLKAIGVTSKKARQLAALPTGEPAADLLPFWPQIEKKMTERILHIVRVLFQDKMDFAAIVSGRPVTYR